MRKLVACVLALIVVGLLACSGERTDLESLRAAGKKAFVNQNYLEARRLFNKALLKAPSDPEVLYFNGLAYKRDYIYDSALIFIKRADLARPNNSEYNREVLDLAVRTENWEYALRAISVLTKNGEPVQNYYSRLAEYTARNKQPLLSLYWQRKVMELDTTNIDEIFRLISIALTVDSLRLADELLTNAERRFGTSDPLVANRAMLMIHEKKYGEAAAAFRALSAKDTTNFGYRLNLANALSMMPAKDSKREALSIYRSIPPEMSAQFKVDSLIVALEKELQ
jgi:tetratricopeptide (TPR) repeat protein